MKLLLAFLVTVIAVCAQQDKPFSFDPADPREGVADNAPHPAFVSSARRLLVAPELADAPDEWIDHSLQWVNFILDHFHPTIDDHPVRHAALIRLDDVLHISSAPQKPLVQNYYRARLERAVTEIEQTRVTHGLRIWKLYNHGFFVRTASVSFTVDIVPGTSAPGFRVSPELLARLVRQSDATFISHFHSDHASQEVARLFLAAGKPVVAPEGLWANVPEFAGKLTYPKRAVNVVEELPLAGGRALKITGYPGHQGANILNNVHLITTPEGFTVVQTGDQSNPDGAGSDFEWLAQIGRDHHVDILLPNCWANGMGRLVRGVNPELVITGHENEMGHTVPHREDYTQTYSRLHAIRYPAVVMTWGESYEYQRRRP